MGQVITLIWLMMTVTMMIATIDSRQNTTTPATRRRQEEGVVANDGNSADMSPRNPNATSHTKRIGGKKLNRTEQKLVATVLPTMNLL